MSSRTSTRRSSTGNGFPLRRFRSRRRLRDRDRRLARQARLSRPRRSGPGHQGEAVRPGPVALFSAAETSRTSPSIRLDGRGERPAEATLQGRGRSIHALARRAWTSSAGSTRRSNAAAGGYSLSQDRLPVAAAMRGERRKPVTPVQAYREGLLHHPAGGRPGFRPRMGRCSASVGLLMACVW